MNLGLVHLVMATLLIFGAGGHGRVVADAAVRQGSWQQVHASDRDPARCNADLLPGIAMSTPDAALSSAQAVHIGIGDCASRRREAEKIGVHKLVSVVHPQASVSAHAVVGAGSFIAAQAVVAPTATLGLCVIVNHGAVADHDVVIGDYCHIAPGAVLGGKVRVGAGTLVGAGATVLPGVSICEGAVIGAGAVVRKDVTEPGTYAGVPAGRIR